MCKNQGSLKFMLCKSRHGGHEKWIIQPWPRADTLGFVTHTLSSVLGLGLATDILLKDQRNRQLGCNCCQLTKRHLEIAAIQSLLTSASSSICSILHFLSV